MQSGRVGTGVTLLANTGWRFDLNEIDVALGFDAAELVNDYVPLAVGLTALNEDDLADLLRIGPEAIERDPRLVPGPVTGLGAAALILIGPHAVVQVQS